MIWQQNRLRGEISILAGLLVCTDYYDLSVSNLVLPPYTLIISHAVTHLLRKTVVLICCWVYAHYLLLLYSCFHKKEWYPRSKLDHSKANLKMISGRKLVQEKNREKIHCITKAVHPANTPCLDIQSIDEESSKFPRFFSFISSEWVCMDLHYMNIYV